jgi:hypothetical protein
MLEDPTPSLDEIQEARATFRTCMSYLTDGEGNLKITPELIPWIRERLRKLG